MGRKSDGGAVLRAMKAALVATNGAPMFSFLAVSTPGATRVPIEREAICDSISVAAALPREDGWLPIDETVRRARTRFMEVVFGGAHEIGPLGGFIRLIAATARVLVVSRATIVLVFGAEECHGAFRDMSGLELIPDVEMEDAGMEETRARRRIWESYSRQRAQF